MKTIKPTLAAFLLIAGILATINLGVADPTPTPTPVPVAVQSSNDMVLVANNVPVAVVEALRVSAVDSGAFAFPAGQLGRPLKSININVIGTKATVRITLGPLPSP